MKHRVRIRFRKEGDLRLISHRDLMRLFERMLRRADLQLAMSEGFHPKPKFQVAAALSLGIAGANEVAEFELAEPLTANELTTRLTAAAPAGLEIEEVQLMPGGSKKLRVEQMTYELPLTDAQLQPVTQAVATLLEQESVMIPRRKDGRELNVLENLEALEVDNNRLLMRLRVSAQAAAGPAELLAALAADAGMPYWREPGVLTSITRTAVEVAG